MWKTSEYFVFALFLLAMSVLATPGWAADLSGSSDDPPSLDGTVEDDCSYAAAHVHCNWCWTNCVYAIMAEAWLGDATWNGDLW